MRDKMGDFGSWGKKPTRRVGPLEFVLLSSGIFLKGRLLALPLALP